MEKYLVIYEEEEFYNYTRSDVVKIKRYDDLEEARDYIAYLKAFGKRWAGVFVALLEVKEIDSLIPDSKISKLRETERLRKEEQKKKAEVQKEEAEKKQLKRLKEKYEK